MTDIRLGITHPPKRGQLIHHKDRDYETIKEGLAYILAPQFVPSPLSKKAKSKEGQENGAPQTVFYNPIQQFNRDLSVLAIKAFGEEAVRAKTELWEKRRAAFESRKTAKKRKRGEGEGESVTGVNGNVDVTAKKEVGQEKQHVKNEDESIAVDEGSNGATETVAINDANGGKKRKRSDDAESRDNPNGAIETHAENEEDRAKKRKLDELGEVVGNNKEVAGPKHACTQENGSATPAPETAVDPFTATLGTNVDLANNENVPDPQDKSTNTEEDGSKPFQASFNILDALSASGLRALRYAKELPFVTTVIANDMSVQATKAIEVNVQHNNVESKVVAHTGDARALMYSIAGQEKPEIPKKSGRRFGLFDVIDLDPYGTAAPFLDAAVQALHDGGLLCVTCTDAGVFASSGYPEKTFSLYGGLPLRGPQSHEAGLRLILNALATSAARYGASIEPLISLSIDFYARVFVRVHRSPTQTKFLAGKTMLVYSCDYGCGAWTTQLLGRNKQQQGRKGDVFWKYHHAQGPTATPTCEHCGFKTHVAGPMWAGPLHSPHFIQNILDSLSSLDAETYPTISRVEGMLTTALEEDLNLQGAEDSKYLEPIGPGDAARLDPTPFFIIPNVLCKVLHCQTPDEDSLRGALKHLGYRVTRSHTKAGAIKTDAPWTALWEIMREWARQKSPIKVDAIKEGTAGWGIMRVAQDAAGKGKLDAMKATLAAAMEKSKDVETLKTEVEAAMYRASREVNDDSSNGVSSETYHNAEDDERVVGKKKPSFFIPPSKLNIVFDQKLGALKSRKKLVRYQMNPRADWGPMNRAKGGIS